MGKLGDEERSREVLVLETLLDQVMQTNEILATIKDVLFEIKRYIGLDRE